MNELAHERGRAGELPELCDAVVRLGLYEQRALVLALHLQLSVLADAQPASHGVELHQQLGERPLDDSHGVVVLLVLLGVEEVHRAHAHGYVLVQIRQEVDMLLCRLGREHQCWLLHFDLQLLARHLLTAWHPAAALTASFFSPAVACKMFCDEMWRMEVGEAGAEAEQHHKWPLLQERVR